MALPVYGLPSTLEEQEDGILAALRGDAALSAVARHIGSWQGKLEDAVQVEALRNPAVVVLYGGADIDTRGGHHALVNVWHVLVRDRDLRRESLRRRTGESSAIGTYSLVEAVLRILTREGFALPGGGELFPRAVELLQTGRDPSKTTSAYLVVFTAELDLLALAPDQELEQIVTTHEIANTDETDGSTTWVEYGGDVTPIETEEG